MEEKKIPFNIISEAVSFIESHDLGPTEISIFDGKQKRDYNMVEKGKLNKLLLICEDLVNNKVNIGDIQLLIKDKLEISDDLSFEITEKIKKELEAPQIVEPEEETKEEISEKINAQNIQDNKKSIFSRLIE